jgi:hypothetical protein
MAAKRLKVVVKYDNGAVQVVGNLTYDEVVQLETIINELHYGNAIEFELNGGLWMSFPEKHTGEYKTISDGLPLASAKPTWGGMAITLPDGSVQVRPSHD